MRTSIPFFFLLASALVSGCSTVSSRTTSENQAIEQVSASFGHGAITLEVLTDPDLNALNGIANSCTLLVVQANNAGTLRKLLSNPFALKSLFSGAGAQDDILKVDRYSAMPGQSATLHIDRSENSRYLAVVAGYYPFPQQQHMSLVAIPVSVENNGWLFPDWRAQLAPLSLRLRLGSSSITQFEGAKPERITLTSESAVPSPVAEQGT